MNLAVRTLDHAVTSAPSSACLAMFIQFSDSPQGEDA